MKPEIAYMFVGANAYDVQFPDAAPEAYKIINAEFTNGVIQEYSGSLTSSQSILHDSNYNRIKNMFKNARLGVFLLDVFFV